MSARSSFDSLLIKMTYFPWAGFLLTAVTTFHPTAANLRGVRLRLSSVVFALLEARSRCKDHVCSTHRLRRIMPVRTASCNHEESATAQRHKFGLPVYAAMDNDEKDLIGCRPGSTESRMTTVSSMRTIVLLRLVCLLRTR
jgi:hypothetical protein